jgi:glucuronoarabinoxylan endo-1,4-beta-xylanase
VYNDASGGSVTATIVAPGAGGTGQALQLSGNLTNGVSENAGVNSPLFTPTGNTDTKLSDYTLSFDMAITQGANSGIGVTLNIFGTSATNGSSYAVPISQITVGGGFQHFSANLGALPAGYGVPALVPTSSQYSFQLLFLGYNATVTAVPETIELDNLQIAFTNSSSTNALNAGTVTIYPSNTCQTIQALGGATAFYDGWVYSHPYRLQIYTNAFAGLNLSMLRLGNWFRYTNPLDYADFDIVSNASRILGHPVPVYMSSWAPPAFLKSNGQTANGGTLLYTNGSYVYTNFAQYWYDSLLSYRSNGVSPTWISIQNEPDWAASYDSCRFDPTEDTVNGTNYASYSKALDATFQRLTNLPAPPLLLAPEVIGLGYDEVQNYAATLNSNSFYGLAHHLYGGSTDGTPDGYSATMLTLTNVFPAKPKFMTEFGYTNMIESACLIHDCLTVEQVVGFNFWQLIDPGNGLVNIENPYNLSSWTNAPAGTATEAQGYWLAPSYWAMKHFSYFVDPGYIRVSATNSDPNVRVSAYLAPDHGRLVFVLINTNPAAASAMTLRPGAFAAAQSAVYQTAGASTFAALGALTNAQLLPPLSLTTVVLMSAPKISSFRLAGGKMTFAGTSGNLSGTTFYTLTATNLSLPLTNWIVVATNQFGYGGAFSGTNALNPAPAPQYFMLQIPTAK